MCFLYVLPFLPREMVNMRVENDSGDDTPMMGAVVVNQLKLDNPSLGLAEHQLM